MNIVVLVGYVATDPIIRVVGEDRVMKFRIAVRRSKEKTDFFSVDLWNPTDFLEQALRKGVKITLQGNLRADEYQGKAGENRTWIYIRANRVELMSPKVEETVTAVAEQTQDDEDLDLEGMLPPE